MNSQTLTPEAWRAEIDRALEGILYITDTESPLTLLHSPRLPDLESLQSFISAQTGASALDFELSSSMDFLEEIHRSADPMDEILQRNVMRFDQLFALLESASDTVQIVRVRQPDNLIFIAAIGDSLSAVIRTEAVET